MVALDALLGRSATQRLMVEIDVDEYQ